MPTPDLASGLDHLAYEYDMLHATAKLLQATDWLRQDLPREEWAQRNALVESFAVHARLLFEFLWKERDPKDLRDFKAGDYVPGWSTTPPATLTRAGFDLHGLASQRIVHLSRKRQHHDMTQEGWPVPMIWNEIRSGVLCFFDALDRAGLPDQRRQLVTLRTTVTGTSHYDEQPFPVRVNTPTANRFVSAQRLRSLTLD